MTIAVRIMNDDKARIVQVEELNFERGNNGAVSFPREKTRIGPGEGRTFYVHLLRELRISEETP